VPAMADPPAPTGEPLPPAPVLGAPAMPLIALPPEPIPTAAAPPAPPAPDAFDPGTAPAPFAPVLSTGTLPGLLPMTSPLGELPALPAEAFAAEFRATGPPPGTVGSAPLNSGTVSSPSSTGALQATAINDKRRPTGERGRARGRSMSEPILSGPAVPCNTHHELGERGPLPKSENASGDLTRWKGSRL
jgi:hypothetical protein